MSDKVLTPRFYVSASDGEGGSLETLLPSPDGELDRGEMTSESRVTSDQDLIDQVTLTNHLLVGIILFLGVFFGAFCMAHLYNRIRRD